jgi:hypothetical protein
MPTKPSLIEDEEAGSAKTAPAIAIPATEADDLRKNSLRSISLDIGDYSLSIIDILLRSLAKSIPGDKREPMSRRNGAQDKTLRCRVNTAFRTQAERRIYAAGGGPGRNPLCAPKDLFAISTLEPEALH